MALTPDFNSYPPTNMKHIENTRASRGESRPLNHRRRRAEMTQAPAWITLAGIAALIAAIYFSTP